MGRRQVRFCQTWGPRLLSPHCLYPTLCDPMDCSPPGCSLCPWGFSRQEYWSGLPSPPPGDLPDPGIKLAMQETTCNIGDLGWILGFGRSPREGNGNPLQYSCRGNPMDRGAWRATVHGVTEDSNMTQQLMNEY